MRIYNETTFSAYQLLSILAASAIVAMLPAVTLAQDFGAVRGKVFDAASREMLIGANVQVEGTVRGSSTNRAGQFLITRLAAGSYTLRVSFIGYRLLRMPVAIVPDSVTTADFALVSDPLQMEQVVVTASREAEPLDKAVVSVSALSSETALRRDALRMDAALASVPGVTLMGENVNIRNSSGYTRGLGSRVLVLIDGIPALTSDIGNMNWDILPVTDFERVEVLKGPASALYGSYALGGVINIITKTPPPQGKLSIRTSAGIYDQPYYPEWKWTDRTLHFERFDASYAKQFGNLGLRISAGRYKSTGDRENRDFQRWNGTAKLIWTPSEKSQLTLFGAYSRDRRGEFIESRPDQPYRVPEVYAGYRTALDAYTFYLQYRLRANDWLQLKWRTSYVRQLTGNQYNVEGDFQPAQGPGADFQIQAKMDSSMSFVLGLEYHYDFAEQRDFGRHFAYTLSPYMQQVWQPRADLKVTTGLRFDQYYLLPGPKEFTQFYRRVPVINLLPDGLGAQYVNPQIGLRYDLLANTVVHAAAGRGIRIPALGERFLQFDQPVRFEPNPGLCIESSSSYELGVRQRLGQHFKFEATAFSTRYNDLIEPVNVQRGASFYLTFVNIPAARISGVEISGDLRLWGNRLGLESTVTWTDPVVIDADTGAEISTGLQKGDLLSYRPRLTAYLTPYVNLGPLTLQADYAYASRLTRVQVQQYKDDQRVPKNQLDVRLIYRWQNLTMQVAVRNLPQYNYTQVERNMNEIRNFTLGLRWDY